MNVIVNELSFQGQAEDKYIAYDLIVDLYRIITALQTVQPGEQVIASNTLWGRLLEKEVKLSEWLYLDLGTCYPKMRDFRILFGSLIRKGPYLESILGDKLTYHECYFGAQDVANTSLSVATLLTGVLASLQKSQLFDTAPIQVKYRFEPGGSGVHDIPNIYKPEQVESVVDFIVADKLKNISSWEELWQIKENLFPNLVFCACVANQLGAMDFNSSNRDFVEKHLIVLEKYSKRILSGGEVPDYSKMGVDASRETSETLSGRKYRALRLFICPDGQEQLFDWHTKYHAANLRMHFFPTYGNQRKILVGYIGTHLPTIEFH